MAVAPDDAEVLLLGATVEVVWLAWVPVLRTEYVMTLSSNPNTKCSWPELPSDGDLTKVCRCCERATAADASGIDAGDPRVTPALKAPSTFADKASSTCVQHCAAFIANACLQYGQIGVAAE